MTIKRRWDFQLLDLVGKVVIIHLMVVCYRFVDSTLVREWRYFTLFVSAFAWVYYRSQGSAMHEPYEDALSPHVLQHEQSISAWGVIVGMLGYSVAALSNPAFIPSVSSVERLIAIFYIILVALLIARRPVA